MDVDRGGVGVEKEDRLVWWVENQNSHRTKMEENVRKYKATDATSLPLKSPFLRTSASSALLCMRQSKKTSLFYPQLNMA